MAVVPYAPSMARKRETKASPSVLKAAIVSPYASWYLPPPPRPRPTAPTQTDQRVPARRLVPPPARTRELDANEGDVWGGNVKRARDGVGGISCV